MSETNGKPPPEDAMSDGPPTGHDGDATDIEDVDFDEALSGLEAIEASRRTKGVIMGVGALVLLGFSLFAIVQFRTLLFRPDLPIEESERQLIDETDDPQCREMIAQVGEISRSFFELEPVIEKLVPGGADERRRDVAAEIDALITRLDEAESLSHRANFRSDDITSDVDWWFQYTREQFVEIRDLVEPDEPTDAGRSDAGSVTGGDRPVGRDAGVQADVTSGDAGPTETVSSQRNSLLFTTHKNLEQFRVWHSSERYSHPCGDADEMETPWRPGPDAGGTRESSTDVGGRAVPALEQPTSD
jgi:hypothetical protein